MKEEQFQRFLEQDKSITSKVKAVNSRMTRARKVESEFRVDLDDVVRDDEKMYQLLKSLHQYDPKTGNLQNAVRKYYLFANGKEFPSMVTFEKRFRP